MTVAPQGEQNPAYSSESLLYGSSVVDGTPLLLYRQQYEQLRREDT